MTSMIGSHKLVMPYPMLTVFDGLTRSAIYAFTRTNGIIVSGTKPDSMMGSLAIILLDIY